MRISNKSRDTSRSRWKHYKKYGGTDDFTSYLLFCEDMFLALRKDSGLPETTENEVAAFILRETETLGIPLPLGAPWEPTNVRGDYTKVIPGIISEMIVAHDFYPISENIQHPQLQEIQDKQAIDLFVDDFSIQVKTVQCDGWYLLILPEWVDNTADYVSLVDIDDQLHWCIPREELAKHVDEKLHDRELNAMSKFHWDNTGKYPRRGDY